MSEEWRAVPGYPGYEVTIDGRIRSLLRGKCAQQRRGRTGYLGIAATVSGKRREMYSHRAVALAWLSPPSADRQFVAHLDGNMFNNHAANLAWVTAAENEAHKVAHGTACVGERNPKAKMNKASVGRMLLRRQSGASIRTLAREFGISPAQTQRICAGENWTHLAAAQEPQR